MMEVVLPRTDCVLDQITCLLCRKIPNDAASTIYLCTNNHLFCQTCISSGSLKGKKCRMTGCQEQVKKSFDPILHDIFLHSFFNCGYNRCPEVILGGDLKNHQGLCHYRPIECPSCRACVEFSNYLQHLDIEHKVNTSNYVTFDDSYQEIDINFPCFDTYGTSVTHFHKFRGENFFTHVVIKAKDVYIWIQYYGDVWKERDFVARITLRNNLGHETEVRVPINPIHCTYKNAIKALSYAHFSKELLKCYLMDANNNNQLLVQRRDSNESTVGMITFQINFTFDFISIFNRSLFFEQQKHGFQSDC